MGDEERINKVYFVQIEAMKRAGANDSAIIAWLLSQGVMGTEKARLVMNRYEREFASVDPVTKFFKSVPLWGWGVGLGVVGILLAGTAYRRSANPRRKRRKSNPARRVPSLADQAKGRAAIRRALKTLEREEAAAKSKSEKSEWARKIKSLRSQLAQIDWDAI
jgi:hypothetical protein